MQRLPTGLAADLRDLLDLQRAVETGTFLGEGARALAEAFPSVVTIEPSPDLHRSAADSLADLDHVSAIHGDSRRVLGSLAAQAIPTLYWLDGHWSGGITAGKDDECPVLDEVRALDPGHIDDCILIDDARLFAAAPPPPHDASHWPTLVAVFNAVRRLRPQNHVTVLHDLILSVPARARCVVDEFGQTALPSTDQAGRVA